MEIISKLRNNTIFGFVLGVILCGSLVYASGLYNANDIKYESKDTSWNVSNVNQAINSLYSMKTELDNLKGIGDATASQILSGQIAVVKGNTVTGTMENRGTLDWSPSTSTSYTIPPGYYSGGTISTENAYNIASSQLTCLNVVQNAWNAGTTSGSVSYTIPSDGNYMFLVFNSAYKTTSANARLTLNGTNLSLTYLLGQKPLYDGGYLYRTNLMTCKKGDVIQSIFNNSNEPSWNAYTSIIILKA